MKISARTTVVAAAVVVLGGASAASAMIRIPPLLPLQPHTGVTTVSGTITSVVVNNPWGKVDAIAGNTNTITEDGGTNLTGPTMTSSVSNGVWTITVECMGADPYAAGLSLDGVIDLVNNCGDDLKITMPAGAKLTVKGSIGDITTSGINGDQDLFVNQDDISVSNSGSPHIKAHANHGNITLTNVLSDEATAQNDSDSSYGYISVVSSEIGVINAVTKEGGVLVSDSTFDKVKAEAQRGNIDIQDHKTPQLVDAHSFLGSVSVGVPRGTYALTTQSSNAVVVSEIINDVNSPNKITAISEGDNATTTVVGNDPA